MQAPSPVAPSANNKPSTLKRLRMPLACLLLLVVSLSLVYTWQHAQVQDAQKELRAAQDRTASVVRGQDENTAIDRTRYQAVFLGSGQVYFGKIRSISGQYLSLTDIYYLNGAGPDINLSDPASQGSVSLVKLGCELHKPEDKMTINRTGVSFWENLQPDGEVSKAIDEYLRQHPDGNDC